MDLLKESEGREQSDNGERGGHLLYMISEHAWMN